MTDQEILIEVAKLDGFLFRQRIFQDRMLSDRIDSKGNIVAIDVYVPFYLKSRDAIIPVIEKQSDLVKIRIWQDLAQLEEPTFISCDEDCLDVMNMTVLATPRQLCIALLKATGKWKE